MAWFDMIHGRAGLGLAVTLALGACTDDPSPGDASSGASEGDTTAGASTSMATTAASTDDGSTGPGSTGGSTGPDPMAEATDCDALREQGACEAVSGADFECVWFAEAYAVTLDGPTCSVGEAIGWCLAAYTLGDTGCVDDLVYDCADGADASAVFVRQADDGTTVVIQDQVLEGLDFACGQPVLWEGCNVSEGPAACVCACDPGLPQ